MLHALDDLIAWIHDMAARAVYFEWTTGATPPAGERYRYQWNSRSCECMHCSFERSVASCSPSHFEKLRKGKREGVVYFLFSRPS